MAYNYKHHSLIIGIIITFMPQMSYAQDPLPTYETTEQLGEALFFDENLSKNRSQSCATCHDPSHGYADPRENDTGGAVSLGDDGHSLGDRNAPTAAYAKFSPKFHKNAEGKFIGGQFLDGREADLKGQAGGPPLNSIEMGMPNKQAIVERLKQNPDYVEAMLAHFGQDIFNQTDLAYGAMAQSIADYEKTEIFAPFDSKYDRHLKGQYKLTDQEELGKLLFFSQQFTNCNLCHQLHTSQVAKQETFSNYEYHNIGVPTNLFARKFNNVPAKTKDIGLMGNPATNGSSAEAGKFRVPTLRNVAVTGPYMHNGVFTDLRTTILFYNKYNSKSKARQINPETGQQWRAPEVEDTVSMDELTEGPALNNQRIDALVAFLKTLTDQRFEYLLED